MNTTLIYISVGVVSVLGGLFLVFKALDRFVRKRLSPIHQTIATDILVSSEWQDISTLSPMVAHKGMGQAIYLNIDGYEFDPYETIWQIELENGTIVEPEIQVEDLDGNVFDLEARREVGSRVRFGLRKGRSIGKIRIRSDKPFFCKEVIWSNRRLNPK